MENILTGKQTLQNIVEMVDIEKVKLPSYTISAKKFNAIADAYTKITYLICMLNLAKASDEDEEVKVQAVKFIEKINNNFQFYSYDNINAVEKRIVEDASNKVIGEHSGNQQIEQLKRTYKTKGLKDTLLFLIENLLTYKKLPETLLHKALCTDYVEVCIGKMTESKMKEEKEFSENKNEVCSQDVATAEVVENKEETTVVEKKSFWKKLFKR